MFCIFFFFKHWFNVLLSRHGTLFSVCSFFEVCVPLLTVCLYLPAVLKWTQFEVKTVRNVQQLAMTVHMQGVNRSQNDWLQEVNLCLYSWKDLRLNKMTLDQISTTIHGIQLLLFIVKACMSTPLLVLIRASEAAFDVLWLCAIVQKTANILRCLISIHLVS